jgi:pilus assembly protein CpaD
MARTFAAVGLALLVCACATHRAAKVAADPPGPTPTEQFAAKVAPGEDEILLAAHKQGLSDRQAAALDDLANRWREAGGGPITIERREGGSEDDQGMIEAITTRLALHGAEADEVRVLTYPAGARPGDAIVVGFVRDLAQAPKCGREWKSFTRSADNEVNNNFGCAVTANIAAMVDNPQDLVSPRPMEPADAQRRQVVLSKYRTGDITSATKDDKASGAVSNAVQ